MVKKYIAAFCILLGAQSFAGAETSLSIDMELYNTLMRTRDLASEEYWAFGLAGKAGLSVKSSGNRNVRADLALDFNFPDLSGIPVITLQKAYVKAKFPSFRITVGKTRLGWGDGFVFNSGDVVFGSISPQVSLLGSEVRTDTDWLTSVNVPLGRFSFVEALVRVPPMIFDPVTMTPLGLGNVKDLGAGGRLYTKLGNVKVEAGYYFDGADVSALDLKHTSDIESLAFDAYHRPYLSLQGNLGADFYLNSSVALPAGNNDVLADVAKDSFNISFGLFHMIEVGYDNSLTLRIESVFLPFLNWSEDDGPAGTYALLLYPEIGLAIGSTVNLSVRSVISPIELSSMITGGFSWNVFEGFNLLMYGNFLVGDGDDTFSWSKESWIPGVDSVDGVSLMAGIQYIY